MQISNQVSLLHLAQLIPTAMNQFSKARYCVKFPVRLPTFRHSSLGRDIRLKMRFNTFGSIIINIILF